MKNGIHFISGLPRSGSTLLAALLRQNPRIHAAMTSPVGNLVLSLLRGMSQENEGAVFIDDVQRLSILKGCIEGYYGDVHGKKLVFDTNRQWTSKLPTVARLYPKAKVICCVRNPAWVLDSVEQLVRRNSLEPSGIFKFDPGGTVYTRAEGLMAGVGMIGFALSGLREAIFDERNDRLLLVRFDSLTRDPKATLAAIYDFIGEPGFDHDPNHIEQDYDALAFDAKLGTPGLHHVGAKVHAPPRRSILPPDLFNKYVKDDFWERPADMPPGVRVI